MNTKTPAMLLQEFTVQKKYAPPEYNLIMSKQGTHENEFHYEVTAAGVSATGMGRSKQVAKHNAAFKAIEMLRELGVYDVSQSPPKEFNPQLHRNEPVDPSHTVVNSIGYLQDLCCEHKLPHPNFNEISDVGPPHCRQFTWECQLASLKTQATANTKKQAKQIAAKHMLERIKDILPELAAESEDARNAITENDDEAVIDKYNELNIFNVIPNKSARIIDFPDCFINLMNERNLKRKDFEDYLSVTEENSMKQILQKLDLEYEYVPIQDTGTKIIILNISTDTPFSIFGVGPSLNEAKTKALESFFNAFELYI